MDYSGLLKEYREKKFMTQKDLADELGVSNVTVNRWETRKFEPTMKIKKKLHKLFVDAKIVEE